MKKSFRKLKGTLLALATTTMFLGLGAACGETEISSSTGSSVSSAETKTIVFENTELSVALHDKQVLQPVTENITGELVWSSSEPSVATVENGTVKALSVGTTVISVTADGVSASVSISVYDSGVAPVLSVYPTELSVEKGQKYEFTTEALWKNESIDEEIEYVWSVKDGCAENVATIRYLGNGVSEIEGVEYGDTEWTISANVFGSLLAQDVSVRVASTAVTYAAGTGVEHSEEGFEMRLSLLEASEDHSLPINVLTYENETLVENTLEWSITAGGEYVSLTEGKLTAVKEGVATLTASYKNVPVKLVVSAYRPEVETNELVLIERKNGEGEGTVALAYSLEGEITGVKFESADIFASFNDGTLSYKRSELPATKDKMGGGILTVDTDKAKYLFDCECYTEVIETKEELYAFGTDHPTDGYYVLGCDIDGADEYPQDDSSWGWTFDGIFDGRGYTIDDFNPKGSGFIYALGDNGIIRNISFTNALQDHFYGQYHAVITHAGGGTFENMYVHVKQMYAASKDGGNAGIFCVAKYKGTVPKKVKNVFVVVDRVDYSCDGNQASGKAGIFGYMDLDDRKMENVYAVAPENCPLYIDSYNTEQGNGDVYGYYASREAMLAAGNNYKAMETENFWRIADGLPYPASMEYVKNAVSKKVNQVEVNGNNGYTVDISDISVDGAMTGVTIDGNAVEGASYKDGILTMPQVDVSVFGEKLVTASFENENGDKYSVSANVLYITKKISSIEEFNNIGTWAAAASSNGNYDGYFALVADLDFENDRTKYTSELSNGAGKIFYGTLDGQGHKLINLTITTKGTYGWSMYFIGKLGDGATVKNLAFINARFGTTEEGGGDTFFTSGNSGLYNVENVYIELTFGKVTWGAQAFGASVKGFKAKNVFVKIGNADPHGRYFAYNLCVTGGYLQGVYFVSDAATIGLAQQYKDVGGGAASAPGASEVYGVYASTDAMKQANNDYTAFVESGYWKIEDGLPVFGK